MSLKTILKQALGRARTPWLIQSCIGWLMENGYIVRPSRGLYRLTDRGLRLLKVLKL